MSELEVVYAAPRGPPPPPPTTATTIYLPPPGPPPPHAMVPAPQPALLPADFPLLSPEQAHTLTTQGFTPLPLAARPALHSAAAALFAASRAFFLQPPPDKERWRVPAANKQGSEEGWSRVPGEKELLTLRRAGPALCPPPLEDPARALWAECGALLHAVARAVEASLAMPPGSLDGVVLPECTLPPAGAPRHETLLRMFRYERPPHGEKDAEKGRLVAEPHRDLGLLSLVIGASPGLEVFDMHRGAWLPIEAPPHVAPGAGQLTATLLVGETLARLTNARYTAGRHRVFVPPAPAELPAAVADTPDTAEEDPRFRHSIVFALRPHTAAHIDTDTLTTPITGPFVRPLRGVRARDLFAAIARTHWNVNTSVEAREAQRVRLQDGVPKVEEKQEKVGEDPPPPLRKRWSLLRRVFGQ